jgi:hypothetical protein
MQSETQRAIKPVCLFQKNIRSFLPSKSYLQKSPPNPKPRNTHPVRWDLREEQRNGSRIDSRMKWTAPKRSYLKILNFSHRNSKGSFVTVVRLGNWARLLLKHLASVVGKYMMKANGKLANRKPSYKLFHHFRPSSEAKHVIRNWYQPETGLHHLAIVTANGEQKAKFKLGCQNP